MDKFRGGFHILYQREEPHNHGLSLAIHVDTVQLNDENPSKAEVEAAVSNLFPLNTDRHTHLHVEHFKQWLQEAYPRENLETPQRTESWMCLVDIVQHMCLTGNIPQDFRWTILILISKGTTDTLGIGLLETLWKVV